MKTNMFTECGTHRKGLDGIMVNLDINFLTSTPKATRKEAKILSFGSQCTSMARPVIVFWARKSHRAEVWNFMAV